MPQDKTKIVGTILCVDDEPNVLSSLNRLLRPLGHKVMTATSGAQGLEVVQAGPLDLIISDMRMPQMDGAAFLEKAAALQPDSIRILLTGYADLASTIAAINRGGIYRYMAKPWEDNDLCLTVQRALEQRFLESERRRLEEITQQQNAELRELNASLDAKVRARTAELEQLVGFLDSAHASLKKQYNATVEVFAKLIELRAGPLAGHSLRVAESAQALARRLNCPEADLTAIRHGALLHDIGKIGLTDVLIAKPFNSLTAEERGEVSKHPLLGAAALLGLDALQDVAQLIRHHHERFDGLGFPDRLKGEAIPFGARILAVVNDYDALLIGALAPQRMSAQEARAFLAENRGKRYDPRVVDEFLALLDDPAAKQDQRGERCIKSREAAPGMVLSRDLASKDGVALLHAGRVLDEALIKRLRDIERSGGWDFTIYVQGS